MSILFSQTSIILYNWWFVSVTANFATNKLFNFFGISLFLTGFEIPTTAKKKIFKFRAVAIC